MYKKWYSRFLGANPSIRHFACHSHYYWPDVTRQAMLEYWDDSATLVDDKWAHWFTELVPQCQNLIAQHLNVSSPKQIVFAPNTHELVYRILSCLAHDRAISVLTTDSEFHSFSRQIMRYSERANVTVDNVPTQPFSNFTERLVSAAGNKQYDLIFISQVFFNSGYAIEDIHTLVQDLAAPDTIVVIDGYHGFMARPTSLKEVEDHAFYLAGSYKYAQGGEGACFAVVPKGCVLRPEYTGWFAAFDELTQGHREKTGYAVDGMRFAGATMDFSALYRLRAVLELFEREGLTVEKIFAYVQSLQEQFLLNLDEQDHPLLNRQRLVVAEPHARGQFLTFALDDEKQTADFAATLKERNIVTDFRGNRLRFGFALYHDHDDIDISDALYS